MVDLIDRQALGVGRCSPDILPAAYCAGWNGLLNLINEAPTVDAVEVVRCGECIHRSEDSWCAYVDDDPDFFCKRGERREEDG